MVSEPQPPFQGCTTLSCMSVRGAPCCLRAVSLMRVAHPDLHVNFVCLPPPCSRVGFYVNTFQSIAGLEENFHKEMSKVGLGDSYEPQGLWALLRTPCLGQQSEAQKGLVSFLFPAEVLHALLTTALPLAPALRVFCPVGAAGCAGRGCQAVSRAGRSSPSLRPAPSPTLPA